MAKCYNEKQMRKMFFVLVMVVAAGGVWWWGKKNDITWQELPGRLLGLVEDTFKKEVEWKTVTIGENRKFAADVPESWMATVGEGGGITITDAGTDTNPGSGETISIKTATTTVALPIDEISRSETVQVGGQEAVVVRGEGEKPDTAYVPLPDGTQVVVTGKGEVFEETYKRIDPTPNEPDWKLLGVETPETERIAAALDEYLVKMAPEAAMAGKEWRSEAVVRITGQPFAYVGYGDGDNRRTVIINLETPAGETPAAIGYYKTEIKQQGGKWVVLGSPDKAIAILPEEAVGYAKVDGVWKEK